jgi:hypothetical protein
MTIGWYLRDLETRTMNPPNTDAPDEYCDGPGKSHDLNGDRVFEIRGEYYCADCVDVLESACDQCGMWRCQCP